MSEIQIVQAEIKDAELIAIVSRETFYDTYAAENTAANMAKFLMLQFSKAMLMAEVGAKGNHFFLAYMDGKLAGYLKLKEATHPELIDSTAIEISRIYVCKPFIGKSVGNALMQTAIDFANANKKEWIWLIAWKENKRALEFYQKKGFEIFSESVFKLGDDQQNDWVLKKSIL
ncbi:MAG: GNAT family N-acetyltransferase [Bacteroidetes bacterium]|nr:GNAT family N-acetyltransferase [Bacteroidota bacterium]